MIYESTTGQRVKNHYNELHGDTGIGIGRASVMWRNGRASLMWRNGRASELWRNGRYLLRMASKQLRLLHGRVGDSTTVVNSLSPQMSELVEDAIAS